MKTFSILKYSATVLVFSVITTLVACGSKSDNQQQIQVNQHQNGFQQCVNCQNLFQATSEYAQWGQYSPSLTLQWNFQSQNGGAQPVQPQYYPYGTNNQYQGYNQYGTNNQYQGYNQYPQYGQQNSVISYNGPVSVNGIIAVTQQLNLGNCIIPAGTYQLRTLAQGQWSAGIVYNLRMQAVGPVNLMLTVTQGQVSAKTGSQLGSTWSEIAPVGRMFANLMFDSVNGYQCSQSVLVQ